MIELKDKMGKKLTVSEAGEKVFVRILNIILDAKLMILRWVGYIPFHTIRKFIYQLSGIQIGKGSTIHMWCNFFNPDNIVIGEDTIVGDHAFLDGRKRLIIGNHVDVASQVLIYNSQHDIESEDFHAIEKEVKIEDYVFIGPRTIILPGVTIGKGAVVGAGAVVTRSIEPFTIVGGIPAQKIGIRNLSNPHYKLGRARLFQ